MFPFRRVATTQAVAALVWGALLLLVPGFVIGLLGAQTDAAGLLMGRFGGGMLFALGATLWTTRDSADPDQRTRIAVANAAVDGSVALFLGLGFWSGVTSGPIGGMVVLLFSLNVVSWLGAWRDVGASGG